MSLYTINRLRKTFGAREVLNIPELIIEKSKIYALLGANGTGKTTLLNLLAFLDVPTEGKIFFNSSQVYFVEKELKMLRRKVIMLDQHPILFSTSVFKNIEFGLKIHKVSKAERRRRVEDALESVGMTEFSDAPAANLSGGETQRVALARVLVLQPQVLLFDEPTSNVDRANQAIIIDLLRELNAKQNISIIFSTHDQNLSSALAHQTIYLDQGRQGIVGVNVFPCTLLHGKDNPVCLLPCGLELMLPLCPRNSNFLIRVKPRHIQRIGNSHNIEDYVIQGTIKKVALENNQIHLEVDAGSIFSLQFTQEEYRKNDLTVGNEISLHIPPDTIEVLEE